MPPEVLERPEFLASHHFRIHRISIGPISVTGFRFSGGSGLLGLVPPGRESERSHVGPPRLRADSEGSSSAEARGNVAGDNRGHSMRGGSVDVCNAFPEQRAASGFEGDGRRGTKLEGLLPS